MKSLYLTILFSSFVLGCAQGNCRRADADVPAYPGQKEIIEGKTLPTVSAEEKAKRVFVYKYDGAKQCGLGKSVAVEEMAKELKNVKIHSQVQKSDGLMRIQMCGTPTGTANVYEINKTDLKEAEKRGFKVWGAQLSSIQTLEHVRRLILDIPDFPKKGINFKDITPVLANHDAFRLVTDSFAKLVPSGVTKILAPESRGFIFGSALVQFTKNAGLVLVRKPGKLPRETMKQSYELEYGTDTLEIHKEQVGPNDRVMIIDDVLATGGTAHAVEQLAKKMGAEVVGHLFFMELTFLKGRERLNAPVHSLIRY